MSNPRIQRKEGDCTTWWNKPGCRGRPREGSVWGGGGEQKIAKKKMGVLESLRGAKEGASISVSRVSTVEDKQLYPLGSESIYQGKGERKMIRHHV